jgi:hypothetical protein
MEENGGAASRAMHSMVPLIDHETMPRSPNAPIQQCIEPDGARVRLILTLWQIPPHLRLRALRALPTPNGARAQHHPKATSGRRALRSPSSSLLGPPGRHVATTQRQPACLSIFCRPMTPLGLAAPRSLIRASVRWMASRRLPIFWRRSETAQLWA